MPEWWHTLWSYRLEDFLMFSPRAHARLFELVNRAWWPAPLLAALLPALLAAALLLRPQRRWAEPVTLGLLALASAVCAELHFRQSLAGLTWIASGWALAFGLQAVLALLTLATAVTATEPPRGEAAARGLAALLLVLALAWPLATLGFGRPAWQFWQAELFALAPDPTVLGWLAWAALTPQRGLRWAATMAVPLAWCVFAGLMGAAMAAPLAAVLPMAAAALLAQRLLRARQPAAPRGH